MDKLLQNLRNVISNDDQGKSQENRVELINNEVGFTENDDELLNLIAEIIVENIVKKIRNGCHRIHKDQ